MRAYLKQERQYYREIRQMYVEWLNGLLKTVSQATGYRLDALSDSLGPLFEGAKSLWVTTVQRFSVRIKKRANRISELAKMVFTDDAPVDMTVNPFLYEPWLEPEFTDYASENVSLITRIGTETADRVKTVVIDAVKNGNSTKVLAAQIKKIDKAMKNRARLIARDQIGKLQANLTKIRAERAGVDEYEWMTAGDERVRSSHKALDGTIRKWSQNPQPGQEIQCRCVAVII